MHDTSPDDERREPAISLLGGKVLLRHSFLLGNAYPRPGDAAIAGGSLIEGIGNAYSDVDVYVITDRLRREREIDLGRHFRAFGTDRAILTGATPDAEVYLIHTVISGTRIKVDVEYRSWPEVERLADEIDQLFARACESLISLTAPMERRNLAFIHRLHNSRTLLGSAELARLRSRITATKFRYLMYRWKAADYSVLLDMQGAWEDRDWIRCGDMARENMVTQFHAYTHLCGNTNYHRKWILTYAPRVGVDPALYDRFLSLLTEGPGRTEKGLRAYVLATLDLVDDVFRACAGVIAAERAWPSGDAALAAIDDHFRREAGDYSENEIAYCKKPYGIYGGPTRTWFGG